MSRIDITVFDKTTEKLVANRAFCREPHLAVFCGASENESLQAFAADIAIGIELAPENMDAFLEKLDEIMHFLNSKAGKSENQTAFLDNEAVRASFVSELESAKEYLIALKSKTDFADLIVAIG